MNERIREILRDTFPHGEADWMAEAEDLLREYVEEVRQEAYESGAEDGYDEGYYAAREEYLEW